MFMLAQVFWEWRLRLRWLRELPSEEPGGSGWLISIRIRILNFLVARYAEPGAQPDEVGGAGAAPPTRRAGEPLGKWRKVFPTPDPVDAPPKDRSQIGPLLAEVHRVNEARKAPRRRWFWP